MPSHVDGIRRLSILIFGEQNEARREKTEHAQVGSVALKDPELVHSNRFGNDGTTIVSVILPDEALDALGHRPSGLLPWQWRHGGPDSLIGLRLASALCRMDGPVVEDCLYVLLGRFASRSVEIVTPEPARLLRIRDRLNEEPGLAPSVRKLASEEGIHPVSLGRAFRRTFGCSITRYRQRARAFTVARELAADGEPLVGIAVDSGFSDQSHMSRVFRRELGVPPGAFRKSLHLHSPSTGLESFKTEWSVTI